jgi:hypothetical protein
MLSAEAARQLQPVSRQAIDKRRRGKTLLAIRHGGDWLYPRPQFHAHVAVPGLPNVIRGLAVTSITLSSM